MTQYHILRLQFDSRLEIWKALLPVDANRRSVSNDVTMPHGPKRSAAVEADYFGYFEYFE